MFQVCALRDAFVPWPLDVEPLEHAFVAEASGCVRILLLTRVCTNWREVVRTLARTQPMTQLAYVLSSDEQVSPAQPPLELDWVLQSCDQLAQLRTAVEATSAEEHAFAMPTTVQLLPALRIVTCADAYFNDAAVWFQEQFEFLGVSVTRDHDASVDSDANTAVLGIGSMRLLHAHFRTMTRAPMIMLALTEQLTSNNDAFTHELAQRASCIFVPSLLFIRAARGTPAIAAKMCVMPYLWTTGHYDSLPLSVKCARDGASILQFGADCPRRRAVHTALGALGALGARYETAVFGDAKRALLATTAVVYVPHYYPPPVFTPVHRLSEVIPYGCALVCEHSQDVWVDQLLACIAHVRFVPYDALASAAVAAAATTSTPSAVSFDAWSRLMAHIRTPILTGANWFAHAHSLASACK